MEINFSQLKDGTAEQYTYLYATTEQAKLENTAHVLLGLLKSAHKPDLYPVTLYEHGLQTATRAYKDGADEELVVAALFHDVAAEMAPQNHSQVGAELLRPFVSERTYRVLAHHGEFQLAYYAHLSEAVRNTKYRYSDRPWFADCEYFCEHWDQAAFDARYPNLPLETLEPLVHRVVDPGRAWTQAPMP